MNNIMIAAGLTSVIFVCVFMQTPPAILAIAVAWFIGTEVCYWDERLKG